jgi:hypothetical protein
MSLDAKFFRKAKKVNRAVEITDTEAIIPAVRDAAEIRVPLPNRRLKTFEERKEAIDIRYEEIATVEEDIEVERKKLLELVKTYKSVGTGAADVVVQNTKIKELMERRSKLARPQVWIEELKGLTLKDVFESKRDTRKIGKNASVYQVKRRVEPITSLYVDIGKAAAAATVKAEETAAATATVAAATVQAAKAVAKTVSDVAKGVIIGTKIAKVKVPGPGPV